MSKFRTNKYILNELYHVIVKINSFPWLSLFVKVTQMNLQTLSSKIKEK